MSVLLVETIPGPAGPIVPPEGPFRFRVDGDGTPVLLSSVRALVGTTGIERKSGSLPEDSSITDLGVSVGLQSPERSEPKSGTAAFAMAGSVLQVTKSTNSDNEVSVYEISAPYSRVPEVGRPQVAMRVRFRVRPSTWTSFPPSWTTLTNMVCPFLQLEVPFLGTALSFFLRDDGANGEFVVAGPLQNLSGGRYTAQYDDVPWMTYPDGTAVELWIVQTTNHPSGNAFEVMFGKEDELVTAVVPVASIGTFPSPSSGLYNVRIGSEPEVVRAFLGNAGRAGDLLEIEDWQVFPYAFQIVGDGEVRGNAVTNLYPGGVSYYTADGGLPPEKDVDAGVRPYRPGGYIEPAGTVVRNAGEYARALRIVRAASGYKAYASDLSGFDYAMNPESAHGAFVEARVRATARTLHGDSVMAGIELRDGEKLFRLCLLDDGGTRKVGLLSNVGLQNSVGGYDAVATVDWSSSPVDLRLEVDRIRGTVRAFVGDLAYPAFERAITGLPSVAGVPVAVVGHFDSVTTDADLDVYRVLCGTSLRSWDDSGNESPLSSSVPARTRLKEGSGDWNRGGTGFLLNTAYAGPGAISTDAPFRLDLPLCLDVGLFIDVAKGWIHPTTNERNSPGKVPTNLWVILRDELQGSTDPVLNLAFYECGSRGRKIALLVDGMTDDDVVSQSDLGRRFSTECDWYSERRIRLLHRPGVSVALFVDDMDLPAVEIPWGGFVPFRIAVSPTYPETGLFLSGPGPLCVKHLRWSQGNGIGAVSEPVVGWEREPFLSEGRSVLLASGDEESANPSFGTVVSGSYDPFDVPTGTLLVAVDGGAPVAVAFTKSAATVTQADPGLSFPLTATVEWSVDHDRYVLASVVAAANYVALAAQLQAQVPGATFTGDNGLQQITGTSLTLGSNSSIRSRFGTGGLASSPIASVSSSPVPVAGKISARQAAAVITSALSPGAEAREFGGRIAISTALAGPTGSIQVTGGSLNAVFNFDTLLHPGI